MDNTPVTSTVVEPDTTLSELRQRQREVLVRFLSNPANDGFSPAQIARKLRCVTRTVTQLLTDDVYREAMNRRASFQFDAEASEAIRYAMFLKALRGNTSAARVLLVDYQAEMNRLHRR